MRRKANRPPVTSTCTIRSVAAADGSAGDNYFAYGRLFGANGIKIEELDI